MHNRIFFVILTFLISITTPAKNVEGNSGDPLAVCLEGRTATPRFSWEIIATACAKAEEAPGLTDEQRYGVLMERAFAVRRLKDLPGSITLYDAALALTKSAKMRAATLAERGRSYDIQKKYERALEDLDAAIDLDPDSYRAHYQRGLTHGHMGNYLPGRSDLEEAFRINPQYYRAKSSLGVNYMHTRDYSEAIANLSDVIENRPKLHLPYFHRGIAYMRTGRYSDALADFSSILKLHPKQKRAFVRRASAYVYLGNYSAAESDYAAADRLQTLSTKNKLARARLAFYAADYPEARQRFAALFSTNPAIMSEARLWHYLASRLERRAHKQVADVLRPLNRHNKWPAPTGRLLSQELSIDDLLQRIADTSPTPRVNDIRQNEARMFEGYRLVAEGNLNGALSFWRQVAAEAGPAGMAKQAADAALRRFAQ